jgi:multicomponent K+:H+ antiporter subunit A
VDLPRTPHEPPRWMKIPVEVLVTLCLLVGIFPGFTVRPILDIAGVSLLGTVPAYDLAVWHGFTLPLAMSVVALAGGALVYAGRRRLFAAHDRWVRETVSGQGLFQWLSGQLWSRGRVLMHRFDNGSLQRYAGWMVAVLVILAAVPMLGVPALAGTRPLSPLDGVSLAAALILAVGAVGTVAVRRRRLLAVIMTGVVGLMVALTFVHFSAPDLALTQLTVEVITTILLLLVIHFLPGGARLEISPSRRVRDLLLAGGAGLGVAVLAFAVMTRGHAPISDYFLANAKPLGGGANVVNVILVDFRGFDTLGEITVLAIAAAGIYAMLRGLRLSVAPGDPVGRPRAADVHPVIFAVVSRPLLPLALLVAVFLLLRGHNAPGGGFIAGLVAGTALILQHLASGLGWTQHRLRLRYFPLVGGGLILAGGTGLAALAFGHPFLTSAVVHLHLPLIGELELASAVAFDLGVFLAVVGTVMLILENLGLLGGAEPEERPIETEGEH